MEKPFITKPEMLSAIGNKLLFADQPFLSHNALECLLDTTGFDKRDEWLIRLGYILAMQRTPKG